MTEANIGKGMVAAKPDPALGDVGLDVDIENLEDQCRNYKRDLI
jgi:hypothetical protein